MPLNSNFHKSFLIFIALVIVFINAFGQSEQGITFHKIGESKIGYGIKKMKHSKLFQGNKKSKNYFEGWYFKMANKTGESVISVIPGISMSEEGDEAHAFIQVINGKNGNTFYKSYPINDFRFSLDKFAVKIAENYFSEDSVILDIKNDTFRLKGKVYMENLTDLTPLKKRNKRIMGSFRFTPFMQCYHGIVSLNHTLSGALHLNDQKHIFDNGKGYIEKDWGRSMPSAWIWIQTNHFTKENTSFMLSIANIPWMGRHFTGFLGFFLHDNEVHRFGTYNRTKIKLETPDKNKINITLKHKKLTYKIKAEQITSGVLMAPVNGSMDRLISEGIDAKLSISVFNKKDQLLFTDSTKLAGLEIVGNIERLK